MDASRGFDIDLRLPPAESHGPARLSDLQACMRSRFDAGPAFAQSHLRLYRKVCRKAAKTRAGKALARSPELYSRLVHHEMEQDGRWHSKVWVIPARHLKSHASRACPCSALTHRRAPVHLQREAKTRAPSCATVSKESHLMSIRTIIE